jgi:murein DD-endopeptidase MepM/ murein hydrolase activator NlpD
MMEQPNQNTNNNTKKPSRMLRLLALCFAFSLPFLLVKFFSKTTTEKPAFKTISLPQPKDKITPKEVLTVQDNEWKVITTNEGDSLAAVFKRMGISAKTLQQVMQDNPHKKLLAQLKPQQKLKFLFNHKTLRKIILPLNSMQYIEVVYDDGHFYTKINTKKMSSHSHYVTATVENTLYGTAKKNNIPRKLIHQMTEIFNWQIDFSKDVHSGDQFTIIYKAYYIEDKLVGAGEILAVTYRKKNKTYKAIRYKNNNGDIEYFDEDGHSLKKAFSRYPIKFSHISSTFSYSRKHPILKYRRAHKGIDLAAPIGTPIKATSDGTIVRITYGGGYGNMIKIKHTKTYSTLYAHMLKFRKGLTKGSKVSKDEVIGYVGQTGLADGPHCHYEFYVNNVPQNPATVQLPLAPAIKGEALLAFKANAQTMLAHLNLFEEAHLAANKERRQLA